MRTKNEEQRAQLLSAWSRCLTAEESSAEISLPDSALPLSPALGYRLTSDLVAKAIDSCAETHLLLHAAGVATPSGAVWALAAESGTGKSTAARTLCQGDFGYVTDELVAIASDGEVVPFPKPLSFADRPQAPQAKSQYGPDELALGRPPSRLRLGGIALLRREPLSTPTVVAITGVEAMVRVIEHTCAFPRLPEALRRLAAALTTAPVVEVTYAEASQLADLLPARHHLPPACPQFEELMAPPPVGAGVRVAPQLKGVLVGDEGLTLVGQRPIRLSPLAVALWEAANGSDKEDLISDFASLPGSPVNAAEIVEEALLLLKEIGVLSFP